VPLTDEGRRQAQRAAVALSGLPLSAIVSSPLDRARETAEILARGWALPVRTDPRLVDTDVGPWAGQQIAELKKSDPRWEQFVQNPFAPPEGVEGFAAVQQRVVASVQEIIADPELGSYVVLVAHADVI
jgi:probable phosphoglycerate mutase